MPKFINIPLFWTAELFTVLIIQNWLLIFHFHNYYCVSIAHSCMIRFLFLFLLVIFLDSLALLLWFLQDLVFYSPPRLLFTIILGISFLSLWLACFWVPHLAVAVKDCLLYMLLLFSRSVMPTLLRPHIAHQGTRDFSGQEYWSGLPFPSPVDLPDAGVKLTSPMSPALAGRFITSEPPGKPPYYSRLLH